MTMLPDIDQQSYDAYEAERLRRELEQRQQSFGLQAAIGEKMAGVQSLVGGVANAVGGAVASLNQPPLAAPAPQPPAEPAQPLPEPAPAPEPAPSQAAPQESAPAPTPDAEVAPPELPSPAASAPPVTRPAPVAPTPPPTRSPSPGPSTGGGGSLDDWIGSALGAVQRAGGDVGAFARAFNPDAADPVGAALGAAQRAGADINAFAASLKAPPSPQPATAPSPAVAAAGGGAVAPGGDLRDYARASAQKYGIDPDIFERQIQQESGFNPKAKSGAGAIGIAQFMPGTAAGMGVDPTDPYAALDAAARMNAQNLSKYGGDYSKMLAAYNAGGGAVDKYGGVPPYEETQRYVNTIMAGQTPRQMARGVVEGVGQTVGGWLDLARDQLNKPYIWGSGSGAGGRGTGDIDPSTGLPKGFDCSGYVSWVMKNGLGVDIPAQTASAYGKTAAISADQARPGDIVFYNMDVADPHQQHMAIYIGNGQIIQAGGTDRKVNIASVNAVGAPEFRRAAGTDAADSRQMVGASVQAAGGMDSQPTPNAPQFQVDRPLTDASGRLTAAATGRRAEPTYMGAMQAAGIGEPQAIESPAASLPPQPQPEQSPVDKLKSAFGDFLDSLTRQPAGTPAQSQAIPSDTLTNPLGSRYTDQPASAQLTGQPAGGIADRSPAPTIPEQIGSAIAENQANPPLLGVREQIANAPVLGGALGMARGPALLTDTELLQMPEADTARALLQKGGGSATDRDVAEATRGLLEAGAVAMTHTPTATSHGRAPRLSEGAIPATGAEQMARAFDQLSTYPAWVRSGIEDFIGTVEGSPSEKANIVYRWLQDNPLSSVADNPSPVAAEQLADDLARNAPPGSVLNGPSRAQPGQMALDVNTFDVGDQPHLPTGEGGVFKPEMLLPDYVPQSVLEAQELARYQSEVARWRQQIADANARDAATGNPLLKGLEQSDFLGDVPDDPRIARWRQQMAESRAREEAGGGMPLSGLEQPSLEGFIPNALELPKRVPENVGKLIEMANQRVSDRASAIDVDKLAQQAGTTPERIRRVWKPDESPANHDTLRAISSAIDDSTQKLNDLQKRLARDPESNDATVAFVKQLVQHQALQEVLEAKPPVAGEALKRLAPNTRAATAEAINQLEAMAGRFKMKNGDELASHFAKLDLSDPSVVADLVDKSRSFTFGDKAAAVWYFALLSSPLTHIKNTLGNLAVLPLRAAETVGSAAADPLARRMLGDEGPRQRYFGEFGQEIEGAARSFDKGIPQAISAITEGWVPERTGDLANFVREPFRGTKGAVIQQPGRWLTAEDAVARNLHEGASRYGIAYREASKLGLKGEELRDMTAQLIQRPTKEMLKEIADEGAYWVFQNKTKLATDINKFRQDHPALRYLMPFTSTPINISRFAGERSPLGLAKIGLDFMTENGLPELGGGRKALREAGSGELADRLSRGTIGTLAWGWAAKQALDGNLTGAAPSDEVEREAWKRDGKQPYAFRNPISGEWTSYRALPMAQMLSVAGDVGQAVNAGRLKAKNDMATIGAQASMAVARDALNQQWLTGLTDFFDAWGKGQGDPAVAMGDWINRQAGGLVPGAVRDTARVFDDTVRDPHNPWEAVAANIPGLSRTVTPQYGAFGEEHKYPSSGLEAMLNPMPGTAETTDPVEKELRRLQDRLYKVEPGMVGKQVTVEGESVGLDDAQQAKYQHQSGQIAKAALDAIVGTPEWNAMTDPEKEKYVQDTLSDARKFIRQNMEPELLQKAFESWKQRTRVQKAS